MSAEQKIFERVENKFLITDAQYDRIIETIMAHTCPDNHKSCTIFSLYFDTADHLLIRRSIDKPVYKEKLRLRTYGIPSEESLVFIEIKKKYKKVVYKRRAEMTFKDACSFLSSGIIPESCRHQQIADEIAWFLSFYHPLQPSMLISYDRAAYYSEDTHDLRITFDQNILWRDSQLSPVSGAWGNALLKRGMRVMEVKCVDAIPLWLCRVLSEAEVYRTSFSKFGTAYSQKLLKGDIQYA